MFLKFIINNIITQLKINILNAEIKKILNSY